MFIGDIAGFAFKGTVIVEFDIAIGVGYEAMRFRANRVAIASISVGVVACSCLLYTSDAADE